MGAQLSEDGPVPRRSVGVEEPHSAAGYDQRGRGELAVVLQVQQMVADLWLGEPVGWGMEVVGERKFVTTDERQATLSEDS